MVPGLASHRECFSAELTPNLLAVLVNVEPRVEQDVAPVVLTGVAMVAGPVLDVEAVSQRVEATLTSPLIFNTTP